MYWLSLKNFIDFRLRSWFRWATPGPFSSFQLAQDKKLREEVGEFLQAFPWDYVADRPHLRIVDIGAKNFFLAPFIVRHFQSLGFRPEVVGIEIDPYRRYLDFKTRAQYAQYYAEKAGPARYFPHDFLQFDECFDFAFLLNPFLTPRPLLAWGLSFHEFCPAALFAHVEKKLAPGGRVILSCPTAEELRDGLNLAKQHRLDMVSQVTWRPRRNSVQKQPRFGALLVRSY